MQSKKIDEFKNSKYSDFEFKVNGEILWKKSLIAKLLKNSEITNPKIKVFFDDFFSNIKKKLNSITRKCFEFHFSNNIGFIKKINLLKNLQVT